VSVPFSGSYAPEDAIFLLKPVELKPMDIEERELRIQSGSSHYSEMIGPEAAPDPLYMEVFEDAMERNLPRLAADFARVAALIARRPGPVTVMSIARSGTPAGVVLARLLRGIFGRDAAHYSFSVIRDRGADMNALNHVARSRPSGSAVYVDGWTGKGVIARELRKSLASADPRVAGGLAVLSDLCGEAALAAGADDWLIPTSLLNSTVSGLVSRTILNPALTGQGDFHGCVYYAGLARHDVSVATADRITLAAEKAVRDDPGIVSRAAGVPPAERKAAQARSKAFLESVRRDYGVTDPNHVKPGIGESTRVLLRRCPELLIVRDPDDPDVRHAMLLAASRGVPVERVPDLAYRAAALIRKVSGAGGSEAAAEGGAEKGPGHAAPKGP
jgi:hypothetical protein